MLVNLRFIYKYFKWWSGPKCIDLAGVRHELLQERACGPQAAGILNPGRISPRHCLRISWWCLEPSQQSSVPVCCAVPHRGSWATKKWPILGLPWVTNIAAVGHVKPPKETFSVTSDSSIASSNMVPRFILWLEMGILSLWWILACSLHHTKLIVWVSFKEELQIFHSVSIRYCQNNYLKS